MDVDKKSLRECYHRSILLVDRLRNGPFRSRLRICQLRGKAKQGAKDLSAATSLQNWHCEGEYWLCCVCCIVSF